MKLQVSGEGPLVMKIPGLAGGVELYHEEMKAAVAAGYRVAALETSGDRADDPAPGPLTWDSLAGEVFEALDRLRAQRAILWGSSFGCLLAVVSAERAPGRVAGLLLCSPPYGRMPRFCERALRWAFARPRAELSTRLLLGLATVVVSGWEVLAPTALVRLPWLALASRRAATPHVTYHDKLKLLADGVPPLPSPADAVPVSILSGAWDLLAPSRGARLLAQRLGARLRLFGFAGHAVAWSRPASYKRAVVEELNWLNGRR